jgi:sigma-70-like protein
MGTRDFGVLRGSGNGHRPILEDRNSDEPNAVVLHSALDSWRAWLTTGVKRIPIDRRRARGAEMGLKNVLMGAPSGAVDFSGAMARQAIDEAMNELPTQHRQVVKLAYFGGLTNREIAQQLGLSVGGVRRRLNESLAIVTGYLERGRSIGRRAMHGLVGWFYWRPLGGVVERGHGPALDQVLQAGVVAAMTVAAAALLVTHQAPPANVTHPHKAPRVASVGSAGSYPIQLQHTGPAVVVVPSSQPSTVATAASPIAKAPSLPVKLSVLASIPASISALPVKVPALSKTLETASVLP